LFGIDNYAAVVRKTLLESGRQIIQNGHVRKISLVSRDKNNHISLPDMVAAREWIVPIDKRLEREEATAILFGCDHSLCIGMSKVEDGHRKLLRQLHHFLKPEIESDLPF